jgi:hypothetical protein
MFSQMLPRERSNLIKPGLPQITHLNICISRETKEFDAIGSWMNRNLTYFNVWIYRILFNVYIFFRFLTMV